VANKSHPAASEGEAEDTQHEDDYEHPPSFKYALQLTFAMLLHVLRRPHAKSITFREVDTEPVHVNFADVLVNGLETSADASIARAEHPMGGASRVFSRPFQEGIMNAQGLSGEGAKKEGTDRWVMLTSGCAPPLPEDWCIRGMEWVGRTVFERGLLEEWRGTSGRKMRFLKNPRAAM